ncbi:MAG: HlyD family efflux transporter periplasmic adaptor subunit, partial [Limisphaerales bacterium]
AVTVAHEFAHGLTCKYFGGEVHELGFLLLYFQPALYCNVSDAWLFREKYKRLWVSFAGPYFELFLLALATFVWRVTDFDTWLNYVSLVVVATSLIKTLVNFNPLIKMDGYYLLSDYLDISNLRRRSFSYIGAWLKRLTGSASVLLAGTPARERRIFLAYGLVASTFSFWFLGYFAIKIGGFLIDHRQRWGFMLFMAFLILKLRRRFVRLFPAASSSAKPAHHRLAGFLFKPAPSPRPVDQPEAAPKPGRRNKRTIRRPLLILASCAVLGAFLFLGRSELRVGGEFVILPVDNADVRAEVEGIVDRIDVDEGDRVHKGQVIARLADRDYRAELRTIEADIDQSQAKLRLLLAGPRPEEVTLAKTEVTKAAERLQYARRRLERDRALFVQNLLSRQDFEDMQQQEVDRQNEWAEAQNKLAVLEAGARKEEIEATKAGIARAEAQRQYLAEQLRLTQAISPIEGVVTTPSRTLKDMRGQLVKKGDLIAKVQELRTITAEMAVSEKEIADVRVGQPVLLKVRAYPMEKFHGKVTSIATSALNSSDTKLAEAMPLLREEAGERGAILVTTQLDNRALLLKPEMTGRAKILCGDHRMVDLVTRRFARTVRVEFWSWW